LLGDEGMDIKESQKLYDLMDKAAAMIQEERFRQNRKWGIQRHDMFRWYAILGEEVGEVAQALQTGMDSEKATDAHDLLSEVIQVAAVAQAMAEQLIETYFKK
jgi:NTP pyrophosphatase (non-canonical NTP hydrolase)